VGEALPSNQHAARLSIVALAWAGICTGKGDRSRLVAGDDLGASRRSGAASGGGASVTGGKADAPAIGHAPGIPGRLAGADPVGHSERCVEKTLERWRPRCCSFGK
jgi:hypothetical protein